MKVVRKSLWRSKNSKRAKELRKLANWRAAKERKRLERAMREELMPDTSHCALPPSKPSGFRITITCLDDGEIVKLTTHRTPWGDLSISPTAVAKKVACLLSNYQAA